MIPITVKLLFVAIVALSLASVALSASFSVNKLSLANGRTSATPGERISVHFEATSTPSKVSQYSVAFALTTAQDKALESGVGSFPFTAVDLTKLVSKQVITQKGFDVPVSLPYDLSKDKAGEKWKLAAVIFGAAGEDGLIYLAYFHTGIDIRFS